MSERASERASDMYECDNQPKNQNLWQTLTCDQGFAFRITF